MMMPHVNYIAIFVSAVISFVIGGVWFSPILFWKTYFKLAGIKANMKPKGYEMPAQFIAALLMVYVLANVIGFVGPVDWMGGAMTGFWVWLGFIATFSIRSVLWDGRSLQYYVLANGDILISLLISGAILGMWR